MPRRDRLTNNGGSSSASCRRLALGPAAVLCIALSALPGAAQGQPTRAEAWLGAVHGRLDGTIWVWPKGRLCATAWRVDAHKQDHTLLLVPRRAPGCQLTVSGLGPRVGIGDPRKLSCLVAVSAFCSYS